MTKQILLIYFISTFSFLSHAQTRLTVLLGSEVSSFDFYEEEVNWYVISNSKYTRLPVYIAGVGMEKYLGYRFGLHVEGHLSAQNKVDFHEIGIAAYDYVRFRHIRLLLQGAYHFNKSLEIRLGPCLNYNHKFYEAQDRKRGVVTHFSPGRPQLGLSSGVNWVFEKHIVLGLYGIYGTDWLFKDQIRASKVLPFNTLGIQLGYRF
jgi:hypothetical protein